MKSTIQYCPLPPIGTWRFVINRIFRSYSPGGPVFLAVQSGHQLLQIPQEKQSTSPPPQVHDWENAPVKIGHTRQIYKGKKSFFRSLGVFALIVFSLSCCDSDIVSEGEVGETFLRTARVKSLEFTAPSKNIIHSKLIPTINSIPELEEYKYRFDDSVESWTVAEDGSYKIHKGSLHKSKSEFKFFVIVYDSNYHPVFVEAGNTQKGSYPSGIASSVY